MGGKRVSKPRWLFNLFITFLISGLWHGANWTYVLWGSINGGYLVAPHVFNATSDKIFPGKKTFYTLKTIVNVIITFLLICFAWIFFRANSISDAFMVINRMIHNSGPLFIGNIRDLLYGVSFLILIVIVEMIQEYRLFNNLSLFHHPNYLVRYSTYISLCLLILLFGVFGGGQFIYFQF
jgi:D-alanyl-lipoteichoic acid acyltransferase DltB (MBOAT superfamily)